MMPKHRGTKSGFTSISCRPATLARFSRLLAQHMLETGRRQTQDDLLNALLDRYEVTDEAIISPVSEN